MGKSRAVMSIYDAPLWDSINQRRLALQACCKCQSFRYPPAPACGTCGSMDCAWRPIEGRGEILSWVVFHRQYFDDFPPPYNAIAVRLEEGPILISNLVGPVPSASWIGREVELCYTDHGQDRILPTFKLAQA